VTEEEWLGCYNLAGMLRFLQERGSERKVRLFGLACVRRIPGFWFDVAVESVLLTAERLVDGNASRAGFDAVVMRVLGESEDDFAPSYPCTVGSVSGHVQLPLWYELVTAALGPIDHVTRLANRVTGIVHTVANDRKAVLRAAAGDEIRAARASWAVAEAAAKNECIYHCRIVQDLVPFHVQTCKPSYVAREVAELARAAYEERLRPSRELEAARLAVLADALEEAGCQNTDILGHLRSPGPHVRGCWPVDLLLGKE
jgi:hypothetical protein